MARLTICALFFAALCLAPVSLVAYVDDQEPGAGQGERNELMLPDPFLDDDWPEIEKPRMVEPPSRLEGETSAERAFREQADRDLQIEKEFDDDGMDGSGIGDDLDDDLSGSGFERELQQLEDFMD
ncbi:MAG TPA: hypothetical protein EYG16_06800 [Deltaproteobacteria bacterium]|nr:hypothetical protein [Candidatus Binatota bacterium]HIL13363.1 hypothetical protein [Deltaproteobacteria bacterium]